MNHKGKIRIIVLVNNKSKLYDIANDNKMNIANLPGRLYLNLKKIRLKFFDQT